MNFNEKLIQLRKEQGLSQEELGYKLNVTRQTVSKWELGQTTPEMDKLTEISKCFNVSLDSLTNEEDTINNISIEDKKLNKSKSSPIKIILIVVCALFLFGGLVVGTNKIIKKITYKKQAKEITDRALVLQNKISDAIDYSMQNVTGTGINENKIESQQTELTQTQQEVQQKVQEIQQQTELTQTQQKALEQAQKAQQEVQQKVQEIQQQTELTQTQQKALEQTQKAQQEFQQKVQEMQQQIQ